MPEWRQTMQNKTNDQMYNAGWKIRFIQETATTQASIDNMRSVFTRTAAYERQWDADLATKTIDELMPMIDAVCGIRVRTRTARISMLRRYSRWCIDNHMPGAKEIPAGERFVSTGAIRGRLVRNPEHLQYQLNKIFDAESELTQDNVYRAFFWLAYGGMGKDRAYNLKVGDIRFEYMEAQCETDDGFEIAVLYRQGVAAIRNCVTLTAFKYKNQSYTNAGDIWRDRVTGNRLLRGIREDQALSNFNTQISRKLRIKREEGIEATELSYDKVWLSGMFYRTYEQELAGIEPDFTELICHSEYGRRALASCPPGRRQIVFNDLLARSGYQLDYINWKKMIVEA